MEGMSRAVAWEPGQDAKDLNNLVVDRTGWSVIATAEGINSAGIIVGQGLRTNGAWHAFVL